MPTLSHTESLAVVQRAQMANSTTSPPDAPPEPKLSGPKRHHFLPRFYLEGFTSDGKLSVYDRESNSIRVQNPLNTGVVGHFYTLEDSEGRKRFELEHMLSEIEGKASRIIAKLSQKQDLDAEERTDLAIFISLAAFRTPEYVDSLKKMNSDLMLRYTKIAFSDAKQVKEQLRSRPDETRPEHELEQDAQEIVDFAKGDHYEIVTDHKWAVSMAVRTAFNIAPILASRDWCVLHRDSPKKSFITTDAPVLLTTTLLRENSLYGVGFANADALVLFPLNESCLLHIQGVQARLQHGSIPSDHMRRINLALASHCQRFVIGRDRSLVSSLTTSLSLGSKAWQPNMRAD